jgi:hypothetical protein
VREFGQGKKGCSKMSDFGTASLDMAGKPGFGANSGFCFFAVRIPVMDIYQAI